MSVYGAISVYHFLHPLPSLFFLFFFFLMIRRPPRSTLLSLHDALPIWPCALSQTSTPPRASRDTPRRVRVNRGRDRKSTRLNSSHSQISYAVFCLKKKKKKKNECE